jgi:hypothetical protein
MVLKTITIIVILLMVPSVVYGGGLIHSCALETGDSYCKDVNDLVIQVIIIAEFLLGIVGSLALLMFIYGGFVYLTAFGKAEQAKKGQQVIAAALVGMVIAFSAFLIVDFLVAGLGISTYFTQ